MVRILSPAGNRTPSRNPTRGRHAGDKPRPRLFRQRRARESNSEGRQSQPNCFPDSRGEPVSAYPPNLPRTETPARIELAQSRFAGGRRTGWLQRQQINKCPCQESDLGLDLRRVACKIHHTPRTKPRSSTSPRNRTSSCSSENCRASSTLARQSSPSRSRTWPDSFGSCHAIHHTHGPSRYPDLESNQDPSVRRA